MLPCKGCAYRRSIPGNCHIKCQFDWKKASEDVQKGLPKSHGGPRTLQWFRFPFNYDPVWGPDECPARAEKADPEVIRKDGPLEELLSLL